MISSPSFATLSPSRRTIKAAVEPEPSPTIIPFSTKAAAANAARSFGVTAVVVTAKPPTPNALNRRRQCLNRKAKKGERRK
jgi:hypothetical protein